MTEQRILQVNYDKSVSSLQVAPHPPQSTSHHADWRYIGIQHHIQPAMQTPKFQPVQHLLVVHLRSEVGVERNLGGSFRRGSNLPGEITVIPAHCDYQLTTVHESEVLLLTIDPSWISHLAQESLDSTCPEIMPHFPQADPLIHGIGLALHTELQSNSFGDSFYIESLCNALSMHLIKRYAWQQCAIQDFHEGLPRHKLSQALDYIEAHLDQEITVKDLSAIVGMSRYYFASLFKQSTGFSPYQYVLMRRVEKAKRLLKQEKWSLADVASACGFANQSHFIRRFRHLTGVTPKAYRDAVLI